MPLTQWADTEKKRLKIYKYQQAIQPKRKRYSMYDATYGTVSVTPYSKLTSQPQFRGCLSLLIASGYKALIHSIIFSLKVENLQCLPEEIMQTIFKRKFGQNLNKT